MYKEIAKNKRRTTYLMIIFVLFVVGIMLLTEGGHLAHMKLFGNEIVQMSKTTFYFVLFILVISDIVQSRYQKKLMAEIAYERAVLMLNPA